MAVIAIGDIHGNLRALDDLLGKISQEIDSGDTVVFLGDYIDRGPDSKGCIQRILDFRRTTQVQVVSLLGNHEQWMLQTCHDYSRHSWLLGMEAFPTIQSYAPDAGSRLLDEIGIFGQRFIYEQVQLPYELFFDAIPPDHIEFLSSLKSFFRSAEGIYVHAGVNPAGGKVEEQAVDRLIWGVEEFPDFYVGNENVVYGHWNNPVFDAKGWPHPRIVGRTYGMDTIANGVLSAIRMPDAAVFQSGRY